MSIDTSSYLSLSMNQNLFSSTSSTSSSSLDFSSYNTTSKESVQTQLDTLNTNYASGETLKKESAAFLDSYSLSVKQMQQSANNLRLDNLDKLLYDSEGNVTEETVQATVDAVKTMADDYNNMMKVLNDNSERGPGVVKQLSRMVTDPAPAEGLAMVGITVADDGTLEVDEAKLTESLSTENSAQLALNKDILGGWNGLADSIHARSQFLEQASAQSLISNDLSEIQYLRTSGNPFHEMLAESKGSGVYGWTHQAATGMLLNMLA